MAPNNPTATVSVMDPTRQLKPPPFYKGRSAWYSNSRHIQMTGVNSYRVGGEQVSLKPFKRERENAEGHHLHNEWRESLKETPIVEKPVKKIKLERPPLKEISLRKEFVRHVAQRDELEDLCIEDVQSCTSSKEIKPIHVKERVHQDMQEPAIISDIVDVVLHEIEDMTSETEDVIQVNVPLSPVEEKLILEAFEEMDKMDNFENICPTLHQDDKVHQSEVNTSNIIDSETGKENIQQSGTDSTSICEVDEPLDISQKKEKPNEAFISVTIDKRYEEVEVVFTVGAKPLLYPGPFTAFTFSLDYQSESSKEDKREKSYQVVEVEETVRIKTRKPSSQLADDQSV